jgi:hypothetical protein
MMPIIEGEVAGEMPGLRKGSLKAFIEMLNGASRIADRCRDDIECCGPARERFGELSDRIAVVSERYRALSPIEQDALWLEVASLYAEARTLRELITRHGCAATMRPPPPVAA